MTFSVYDAQSNKLLVEIQNNHVTYVDPGLATSLEKIRTVTCFPFHLPGEQERIFGHVEEITREHPLYATALRMHFEAKFLTHPESFINKPST